MHKLYEAIEKAKIDYPFIEFKMKDVPFGVSIMATKCKNGLKISAYLCLSEIMLKRVNDSILDHELDKLVIRVSRQTT